MSVLGHEATLEEVILNERTPHIDPDKLYLDEIHGDVHARKGGDRKLDELAWDSQQPSSPYGMTQSEQRHYWMSPEEDEKKWFFFLVVNKKNLILFLLSSIQQARWRNTMQF